MNAKAWFGLAQLVIAALNWLLRQHHFRQGWDAAMAEMDAATKERLALALAARAAPDVVRDDDPHRRD